MTQEIEVDSSPFCLKSSKKYNVPIIIDKPGTSKGSIGGTSKSKQTASPDINTKKMTTTKELEGRRRAELV